ncbi:MAG: hypothetical protein H7343_10205 [Undibacterium sp.]|nr:hypothetical protein [Opitutaceae bacterium]
MNTEDIIAECIERKKTNAAATPAEILNGVMDEIALYRAAMRARPEFQNP